MLNERIRKMCLIGLIVCISVNIVFVLALLISIIFKVYFLPTSSDPWLATILFMSWLGIAFFGVPLDVNKKYNKEIQKQSKESFDEIQKLSNEFQKIQLKDSFLADILKDDISCRARIDEDGNVILEVSVHCDYNVTIAQKNYPEFTESFRL